MDVIKTYIPKRFRNKKLVNTGSGSGSKTIINSGNDISPSSFVDSDTFYSMFELVDLSGTPAIKAKHEFFSVAGVTAYGTGTVATGGSGSSVSVLDVLNSTDTGSALSANMGRVLNEGKLNRSEISSWALGANKPAYGISEITGLSASLSGKSAVGHVHTISEISDFAHVHQWSDIQNKPTTFAPSAHTHLWADLTDKPDVFTPDTHDHYVADILNFPTSMPASDVYSWAKAATKPTYNFSEIGSKPTTLSGYGITDAAGLASLNNHISDAVKHITSTERNSWNATSVNSHLHNNKTSLDAINQFLSTTSSPTFADLSINGISASNKSVKNFIDKFNSMFDTDANGNIIAKTNLYSLGGISAYQSGAGVSGLTLQGDMNANGKNITYVGSISSLYGLALKTGSTTWLALGDDGIHNLFGEVEGLTSLSSVDLNASGKVTSSEFKFGNWTFKQDASGRLGIYNGASEVACFDIYGTYVNL